MDGFAKRDENDAGAGVSMSPLRDIPDRQGRGGCDMTAARIASGRPAELEKMRSPTIIIMAAATALLAGLASTAVYAAQEPGSSTEIVVEAPRTVAPPPPSPAQRSQFTGAPVVTTTVRISALYGDLDLAQADQAARLMTRLDRVAHDACGYLDRLVPLSSDPACVGRAVALATPAAKAAIAAAQK